MLRYQGNEFPLSGAHETGQQQMRLAAGELLRTIQSRELYALIHSYLPDTRAT